MIIRFTYVLILLLMATTINAQHDAHYTQFMSNKLVLNPAYAGSREAMSVTALYRHQWLGLEGSPKTATISANVPIVKMNSGLGLSVLYDRIGLSQAYHIDLAYAYGLKLSKNNTLNIGAMARLEHFGVRWDEADPLNPGDIDIPDGQPNRFLPDFGIGAYFYNPRFYLGISVPHLLKNELYIDDNTNPNSGQYFANQRHAFLMAGGLVPLSTKITMKPAILLKYQPESPFDVDFNMSFIFLDALWLGATYRLGSSIDGIIQYQFKPQIRLGIAYDYPLNDLRVVTPGSLEMMIDYIFKYENKEAVNVRFF